MTVIVPREWGLQTDGKQPPETRLHLTEEAAAVVTSAWADAPAIPTADGIDSAIGFVSAHVDVIHDARHGRGAQRYEAQKAIVKARDEAKTNARRQARAAMTPGQRADQDTETVARLKERIHAIPHDQWERLERSWRSHKELRRHDLLERAFSEAEGEEADRVFGEPVEPDPGAFAAPTEEERAALLADIDDDSPEHDEYAEEDDEPW